MPYLIKVVFICIWVMFFIYFIVRSYVEMLRQEILNSIASAIFVKKNIVNTISIDKVGVYLKILGTYI